MTTMQSESLGFWSRLCTAGGEELSALAAAPLVSVNSARASGDTVYPAAGSVFAALRMTPPQAVRVIILGQDPYHEPGQAMGLAFSVPDGVSLPPSLRNIYKELYNDLGIAPASTGNLTAWAEQGVLLLNSVLTVKQGSANSHSSIGWQAFTRAVLASALSASPACVCMGWGRSAIALFEEVQATECGAHLLLRSTHPSPLSASRSAGGIPAFLGSRPFSAANAHLAANGLKPVDWSAH